MTGWQWILFGIGWYLSGLYAFVWWESTEHDVYLNNLDIGWLIAAFGPIVFIMGIFVFGIHGVHISECLPKILIKRRR